jgi:hypothetical protein
MRHCEQDKNVAGGRSFFALFSRNAAIGSIRQIGLERRDLRGQLLNPRLETAHMSVPRSQGISEHSLSTGSTKKHTHRVSCNVRYAARAGK